jgi:hypothetical protein
MIQFYKPNPKVTGTACSFWVTRDGVIMASLIKQDSWNDQKKIGSFSKNKDNPNARVIIKLSRIEVAGIIDAMEREVEYKIYHDSQKQVLQGRFCLYLDKNTSEKKGFSFSVNKQDKEDSIAKASFIIGFTYPEARLLKHELETLLMESREVSSKGESRQDSPAPTAKSEQREQRSIAPEAQNSEDSLDW